MPEYYKNIDGFFNFEGLYESQVDFFQDESNFLEIGCYHGKSTIFLSELIKESNKKIKLHVIDTFDGYGNSHKENNFYDLFKKHVINSGCNEIIKIYSGKSEVELLNFEDNFFDFIYIDGSHDYVDVVSDIEKSMKKLKCGGVLSGHDYNYSPVKNAVNDVIGKKNLKFYNNSWIFNKV